MFLLLLLDPILHRGLPIRASNRRLALASLGQKLQLCPTGIAVGGAVAELNLKGLHDVL
jgi:hypothetical protein